MFEISNKTENELTRVVGLSTADFSLLYSLISKLVFISEYSLRVLNLVYNTQLNSETKIPKEVRRIKLDLSKKIQELNIGHEGIQEYLKLIKKVKKKQN